MEKNKIYNMTILISFVVLLICLLTICSRKEQIIEKITYDTTYIEKKVVDTLKVPTPFYIQVKVPDSVKVKIVDSAFCMQIAEQLYSKNVYKRNLVNDSNLTVDLIDTVTQNKLCASIIDYKIRERYITKTIEKTIIKQPKQLSFQIQATTSFDNLNVLGGFFIKNYGILGGYDIVNQKGIIGASIKF